ncbi:MAG: winged helix-turn-helix transcriptional regulator [Actinomycetales bacterium]|nr:winged helix-turn-helix transcriptional regulator [Actinomycetales bacterium]
MLALRASFNLVRLSTMLVHRLESQVHREAGWSMAGFRVFCVWVAAEMEPRGDRPLLGPVASGLSSVLNTLERDGLVERHRESADRRLVTVRLTATGEERLAAAYGRENDVETAFFARLGPDLEQFVELMRRLLRGRTE